MLTWGELERLIAAEIDEDTLPESNGVSSVNAALRTLASHWAYGGIYNATVTNTGSLLMPSDYLQMHGVRAVGEGLLMIRYPSIPDDDDDALGWYEFPSGTLHFVNFTGEVQVFYYSYYPQIIDPEDKNLIIPIPAWSVKGVLLLSSAYMQFPKVISDSTLNQFNTGLDSGNPEDIPLILAIKFLRDQYEEEMRHWPKQKRELMLPNPRGTYGRNR